MERLFLVLCVVACKEIEGELASDAERIQAALKNLRNKEYLKGLLTDIWEYMKKTPENLRTNLENFKQWMNTQAGKRMVARYLKDIIKNTEDILDEEARAYLTEQFENSSQYAKLKKLIKSAESAKEAKGGVLDGDEIRYVNHALDGDASQEVINQVIQSGIKQRTKPSRAYDPLAKPSGPKTKIHGDPETQRSLMRENEAAELLAQNGYQIEQNPKIEGSSKNPDYRMEGRIFDCYSPNKRTPTRSVWDRIQDKINGGQTKRVVVNLDDWKRSTRSLEKQLQQYPIKNLEEVIAIRDGNIIHLYP